MAPIMTLAANGGQMGPGGQPPTDLKPDPAMMGAPPPGTELGEIKYNAASGDMDPQNCEVCGKSFQYRYQLIVHRRYHAERKPFSCQVKARIWKKQRFPDFVFSLTKGHCDCQS